MITATRPVAVELDPQGHSSLDKLDLKRFAETLSALEFYVDSIVESAAVPSMDPWLDDEVTEVRLASL